MNYQKMQSGSSLVEVLVSLLVLSIGLLGLAILQTKSLRYNTESQQRATAIWQVHAMTDRMRANGAGVEAGSYNAITSTPTSPSCSSSCTATQIATRDAAEWNTENSSLLPSGQGTVTANGNHHTITVMWDAERTGVTGTNCSGDTSVDLTCLRLVTRL